MKTISKGNSTLQQLQFKFYIVQSTDYLILQLQQCDVCVAYIYIHPNMRWHGRYCYLAVSIKHRQQNVNYFF